MPSPQFRHLSRREKEIMDIVYARGEATASEILAGLPDPPSYSAVRGLVRVLVDKGHLRARRDGVRNVYAPTSPRQTAGRSALKRALDTFFSGDVRKAVATLLDVGDTKLPRQELERIRRLIEESRRKGR